MPSGCLVTKDVVSFDIGLWQHKTYEKNDAIWNVLRGKWCPKTINLLILDELATLKDLDDFLSESNFEKQDRNAYYITSIAIKRPDNVSYLQEIITKRKFIMDKFLEIDTIGEYVVLLNQFLSNIRFL